MKFSHSPLLHLLLQLPSQNPRFLLLLFNFSSHLLLIPLILALTPLLLFNSHIHLLTTKPKHPNASFVIAARPYATGPASFDNTTTTGFLHYHTKTTSLSSFSKLPLLKPSFPSFNDTVFAMRFNEKVRRHCPNTTESMIWYDVCLVRFWVEIRLLNVDY